MPLKMFILRKGSWAAWQDCKEENNGRFGSKKEAQRLRGQLPLLEDPGPFPITLRVAQNHL